MQIRETDYTSFWHGKEGKESRGKEEKRAWNRKDNPPLRWGWVGRKAERRQAHVWVRRPCLTAVSAVRSWRVL